MVLLVSSGRWGRGGLTFWDSITELFCMVGVVSTDSNDLSLVIVSTELV